MVIHKPHLLTTLDIWSPRYSDKYGDTAEWVVLVADYKLQQASPVVLINFTKSKHLKGQRFAINRQEALGSPLDTNGKIACRAIPFSSLESWETAEEVRDLALSLFDN